MSNHLTPGLVNLLCRSFHVSTLSLGPRVLVPIKRFFATEFTVGHPFSTHEHKSSLFGTFVFPDTLSLGTLHRYDFL